MKYKCGAFTRLQLFIACGVLFFPAIAWANVRVTEIAWMGTSDSSYCEWFELYNDSTDDVSLSNWKLYEGGGTTVVIALSKTIAAHEYLIVERTTATCPDPVAGVEGEAGSFGGSGFSNAGENLVLKDSTGASVDTLDFSGGWPAGDATTKDTMQRNGSTWVTAAPTPGAATDATTDDGSSTDDTPPKKEEEKEKIPTYTPHITITAPKTTYSRVVGTYTAEVTLEHYRTVAGTYIWNMGDGTMFYQNGLTPVRYVYQYAGTYTITLGYFSHGPYITDTPELMQTISVAVVDPHVTLSIKDPGWIALTNTATTAVDISSFKIITPSQTGVLPPFSILAPKASVAINLRTLGIYDKSGIVSIATPDGAVIASVGVSENATSEKTEGKTIAQKTDAESSDTESSVPFAPLSVEAAGNPSQDGASTQTDVQTNADTPAVPDTNTPSKQKSHTNTLLYGIALLFVIGLSVLLERVMARRE